MNRRSLIFGAAGAAAALALAACGKDVSGAGGTTKVNFGYIGDYNGTSLIAAADDQKLWAKHGLEVSTKVFTTGPLQVTALGAGDLDFGYIGPGAIWLPASGKTKIVAMNSLGNADRLIAKAGITTVAGTARQEGRRARRHVGRHDPHPGAGEGRDDDEGHRAGRDGPADHRLGLRLGRDRRRRHLVSAAQHDQGEEARTWSSWPRTATSPTSSRSRPPSSPPTVW